MATQPIFPRPTDPRTAAGAVIQMDPARRRNPFELRALPQEDVFFFCKKIDNSRLEREPDPKAPRACWSAIGTAALAVALIGGVLLPNLMSTLAGYQLEKLRAGNPVPKLWKKFGSEARIQNGEPKRSSAF